ncbi:MAG TPA: M28 family peptidase [Blastocatellia bacterium]|nr:M28 family peptidase [Blastocatellia bacterium]
MFRRRRLVSLVSVCSLATALIGLAQDPQSQFKLTADQTAAIDSVSAESLRGHLSFIASDLLEGRETPSRGLDLAAEYIAAQFRRAGIEAAGDDGYFQTANWLVTDRDLSGFVLRMSSSGQTVNVSNDQIGLPYPDGADLSGAPVFKLSSADSSTLNELKPEQITGRIVLVAARPQEPGRRGEAVEGQSDIASRMKALKAAAVIAITTGPAAGAAPRRLIDPENRPAISQPAAGPFVVVNDSKFAALFETLKPGASPATIDLKVPALEERPVKLHNVVGVLQGSDSVLRDTFVLVTAHYDHLGVRGTGEGDHIFNGANDDGSGTASVIELASALSRLKPPPKRSIVFMTFFGEERGLLGSRFYGRHPVFPINKTVADINLEQVGRTDSTEGPQIGTASLTGYDYSEVGTILTAAGHITGIKVYKHERNSDAYFNRSDNQALATLGVAAHTLCVAYDYPDYHKASDHWDKIDYANMAKVVKMVAVGILMIAERTAEPTWNESNPKAQRYAEAWKARRSS